MGPHRLAEQRLADALALPSRPHIKMIDPAVAERNEAIDRIRAGDPDLTLREHHVAHEPDVFVRRMQLGQERQARAQHKPQQVSDCLYALLIRASDHMQRLFRTNEFSATKISYAPPSGQPYGQSLKANGRVGSGREPILAPPRGR